MRPWVKYGWTSIYAADRALITAREGHLKGHGESKWRRAFRCERLRGRRYRRAMFRGQVGSLYGFKVISINPKSGQYIAVSHPS